MERQRMGPRRPGAQAWVNYPASVGSALPISGCRRPVRRCSWFFPRLRAYSFLAKTSRSTLEGTYKARDGFHRARRCPART